jgi:hypothetical protein
MILKWVKTRFGFESKPITLAEIKIDLDLE